MSLTRIPYTAVNWSKDPFYELESGIKQDVDFPELLKKTNSGQFASNKPSTGKCAGCVGCVPRSFNHKAYYRYFSI